MDKVQIYYAIMFSLSVIVHVGKAVYAPDALTKDTNRENFKYFVLALLLSLPVFGRIFAWW